MRAYLMTTGTLFTLIFLAHLWRMAAESPRFLQEPLYLLLTVLAGALAFWAWRLLRSTPRT